MADDRLPGSIQESIACCVALVEDQNSHLIASMCEAKLFDEPFDEIIAACCDHRKKFNRPPGREHIDDLFGHIIEDPDHKSYGTYRKLLEAMFAQAANIDSKFVLSRVSEFNQLRMIRTGLSEAAERYQKGGQGTVEDIELVLRKIMNVRRASENRGFTLADPEALNFLDRDIGHYLPLGIPELDRYSVVPTKRELLGFLGARNKGKSQFLHHCGKQAFKHHWKVAHYTLENGADMTAMRYWQTLHVGVRREDDYLASVIYERKDGDGIELGSRRVVPNFIIANKDETREFLEDKLTYEGLERDLDELAVVHKFYPDMVLIDSPQLMKLPRRPNGADHTALDELVINLRGLMDERNIAGVITHQGTRGGETAELMEGQHGSGSIGVLGIVDNYITYSQTKAEESKGIARLFSAKVRNDLARQLILITQHYASGQFCVSSHLMTRDVRDALREFTGSQDEEDDVSDEAPKKQRKARA